MITELLTELRNYFKVSEFQGEFQLSNSLLTFGETIKLNQYIYIRSTLNRAVCKVTSINNDVYTLESDIELNDDSIKYVALLAIPQQIISLATEIDEWNNKYNTPYVSESFNGWSGSMAQGTKGVIKWQENFNSRLMPFRKMFSDVK